MNSSGEKVKQIYRYQVYIPPDTGGGGTEGLLPGGESALAISGSQVEGLSGPGGGGYWQNREEVRYYIWSGGQVVLELDNPISVSQVNIYGLGRLLARRDYTLALDSLNVLVTDYLGSVHGVVRGTGVPACAMWEYYPYGGFYSISGANRTYRQFIGKELDKTAQLDFGPRYYGKELGRFLAPDPIPAGASPYSYAEGNPVMLYDPSGLTTAYPIPPPPTEEEIRAYWREFNKAENAAIEAQNQQDYYDQNCRGEGRNFVWTSTNTGTRRPGQSDFKWVNPWKRDPTGMSYSNQDHSDWIHDIGVNDGNDPMIGMGRWRTPTVTTIDGNRRWEHKEDPIWFGPPGSEPPAKSSPKEGFIDVSVVIPIWPAPGVAGIGLSIGGTWTHSDQKDDQVVAHLGLGFGVGAPSPVVTVGSVIDYNPDQDAGVILDFQATGIVSGVGGYGDFGGGGGAGFSIGAPSISFGFDFYFEWFSW
ncbi:MAG: RHS repeat-associated core domain-containing protein [Candidatus Zixiibacteriota bacterium]